MNASNLQQLETESLLLLLESLLRPILIQVLPTLNPRYLPILLQKVPPVPQIPQHRGQLDKAGILAFGLFAPVFHKIFPNCVYVFYYKFKINSFGSLLKKCLVNGHLIIF